MRLQASSPLALSSLLLSTLLIASLVSAQQNNQQGGGAAVPSLPALTDTKGNVPTAQSSAATKASDSNSPSKPTNAPSKTTAAPSLPDLTSSGAAASSDLGGGLTGLPKLAGDNYPPPTVPPTADAPYMQKSKYPEGTVFICVGAALGFIAFLILAWRGLVVWSIHRSVRRAANLQTAKYGSSDYEKKGRGPSGGYQRAGSQAPPPAFYNHGPGSTLSIDQLSGNTLAGAGGKSGGGRTPGTSGRNSLFFSPTATAGGLHAASASTTSVNNPSSARASAYLPAGYYASGNSTMGGGSNKEQYHHARDSIALSNLNPNAPADRRSKRHSKPLSVSNPHAQGNHSPPGSPSLAPSSRGAEVAFGKYGDTGRPSTAGGLSVSGLDGTSGSRAPSAYLDDLLGDGAAGVGASDVGQQQQVRQQQQQQQGDREAHRRENDRPEESARRRERRERRESKGERGESGRRRRSRHQ